MCVSYYCSLLKSQYPDVVFFSMSAGEMICNAYFYIGQLTTLSGGLKQAADFKLTHNASSYARGPGAALTNVARATRAHIVTSSLCFFDVAAVK